MAWPFSDSGPTHWMPLPLAPQTARTVPEACAGSNASEHPPTQPDAEAHPLDESLGNVHACAIALELAGQTEWALKLANAHGEIQAYLINLPEAEAVRKLVEAARRVEHDHGIVAAKALSEALKPFAK